MVTAGHGICFVHLFGGLCSRYIQRFLSMAAASEPASPAPPCLRMRVATSKAAVEWHKRRPLLRFPDSLMTLTLRLLDESWFGRGGEAARGVMSRMAQFLAHAAAHVKISGAESAADRRNTDRHSRLGP